ncbi:MAG: AAA family ATPase [Candidatus Riflebacteria bacterium]|nr:AAA family ATPase [Candidatus Riflebacteria bacterium]
MKEPDRQTENTEKLNIPTEDRTENSSDLSDITLREIKIPSDLEKNSEASDERRRTEERRKRLELRAKEDERRRSDKDRRREADKRKKELEERKIAFAGKKEEEKLPFDIKTIFLAFLQHWKGMLFLITLILVAAFYSGKLFGKKIYESETIIQFKPSIKLKGDAAEGTALITNLNIVKTPINLEQTRLVLGLSCSIQELGASCDVRIQKNTTLMSISTSWGKPDVAAKIATTLRDIFIENHHKSRQFEAGKQLKDIQTRLEDVSRQLKKADDLLQTFTIDNKIIDLDKEAQWFLEQLISLENMYEQAQIEERTIKLQTENLKSIMEDLKKKIAEESASFGRMDNIGDLNIKAQRLRDSIHEDKQYRSGITELAQKEHEYKTAQKLFEKKLIPEAELEKAKNSYLRQKALASDTEQIKKWKSELEKLNDIVIPNKGESAPSAPLLRDLMLRSFNLELEKVAVSDKVLHLESAKNKVKTKLDNIPVLQRQFSALSREVQAKEIEKKKLEEELVSVMSAYKSTTPDYKIISDAQIPTIPVKSNAKMIVIAVSMIGVSFVVILFLFIEIINTTIRSPGEFSAKFSLKLLEAFPLHRNKGEIFPGEYESVFVEKFRKVTNMIRHHRKERGLRMLVFSAHEQEGKTFCTMNIAACLGRSDERVLVIDGMIREGKTELEAGSYCEFEDREPMGLGEYLSYKAVDATEAIYPTRLPGVSCMPRIGTAVIPELLASNRMKDMLSELSSKFSLILIDAPAALSFVDTEILARNCDCAIMVLKAGKTSSEDAKKAIEPLLKSSVPIIGVLLNQVQPLFMYCK